MNNQAKKRLALIGSKDLAQQLIPEVIATGEYEIFGYFDDFEEKGTIINGYKVYGKVDDAIGLYKEGLFDCIFIAIGYYHFDVREKFYEKLKGIVPLANIISKDAHLSKSAKIGEGVYLGYGTQVGPHSVIEDNVVVMGNTVFGHNNIIHKNSYFSGGVYMAGFTSVGERCFVGISVTISDKIKICDDVWIGLGMIVYRNILKPGKYSVLQKIIKL